MFAELMFSARLAGFGASHHPALRRHHEANSLHQASRVPYLVPSVLPLCFLLLFSLI
jgi:hypothetical protein